MNRLLLASTLLLLAASVSAQDFSAQGMNQLEISHDTETEQDIIEEWLDFDLFGDLYQLGFRYSSFSPPDPVVSGDGKASEGITHRFAELQMADTRLRVGTFTRLFGRGLALRSFENRNLRLDTNLDGLLLEYSGDDYELALLSGRALSGQMETGVRERKNRVSGADLGYMLGSLDLGASFVTLDAPTISGNPELQTLRAGLSAGPLRIDWEGGRQLGDPRREDGRGDVIETSLIAGSFSVYGAWKSYRDMALMTHDGQPLNQPPVLIHDHRATLLNRHPHELDADDESGFLVDLSANTRFGSFLLSGAETGPEAGVGYRERFVEWDKMGLSGSISAMHAVLDWKEVEEDVYLTAAVDLRLDLCAGGELLLEWEHQHKKSDRTGEYDDELLAVEYQDESGWTVALIGELLNWSETQQQLEEPESERRRQWFGFQVGTAIGEHHELRAFFGGRRAGYICVGGVCRYEPAFDGVELSLLSRF